MPNLGFSRIMYCSLMEKGSQLERSSLISKLYLKAVCSETKGFQCVVKNQNIFIKTNFHIMCKGGKKEEKGKVDLKINVST